MVERFVEKQGQDLSLLYLLGERNSCRQQQLGPRTVREFIELPSFSAAQLNSKKAGRPFVLAQPQFIVVISEPGEMVAGAFEDVGHPGLLVFLFDSVDEISPCLGVQRLVAEVPQSRAGFLANGDEVLHAAAPLRLVETGGDLGDLAPQSARSHRQARHAVLERNERQTVALSQFGFAGFFKLRAIETDLALKTCLFAVQFAIALQ